MESASLYVDSSRGSVTHWLDHSSKEASQGFNSKTTTTDSCKNDSMTQKSGLKLLPVSANNVASLNEQIKLLHRYIESKPDCMDKLATTLGTRREYMATRSFLISNHGKISQPEPALTLSKESPGLVYVFTGQGAQWVGVAKELAESCELFRQDIKDMDKALQNLEEAPSWSLGSQSFPLLDS